MTLPPSPRATAPRPQPRWLQQRRLKCNQPLRQRSSTGHHLVCAVSALRMSPRVWDRSLRGSPNLLSPSKLARERQPPLPHRHQGIDQRRNPRSPQQRLQSQRPRHHEWRRRQPQHLRPGQRPQQPKCRWRLPLRRQLPLRRRLPLQRQFHPRRRLRLQRRLHLRRQHPLPRPGAQRHHARHRHRARHRRLRNESRHGQVRHQLRLRQ